MFTFVKEYENIGFVDAVRRLAERAKIPLEFDQNPAAQESRHLKDQLLEIHEQIAQRWQNCLANEAAGQLARDYLAKRGVSRGGDETLPPRRRAGCCGTTRSTGRKAKTTTSPLVEKAGLIHAQGRNGNIIMTVFAGG